jgi:hypothetical protein
MVRARAAESVYDRSQDGECQVNLSRDVSKLNAELGLQGKKQLTAADFSDPASGFRAALYRSESNGRYILAFAGTDPHSLSDWKTNIDNGLGKDTEQYKRARKLADKLAASGIDFDLTGHSKGGGMATDAGLRVKKAKIWTFNSSGLNRKAPEQAGVSGFGDLAARTQAFYTRGDFLTQIQNEKDPEKQLANAIMLRDRLGGADYPPHPIELTQTNPDNLQPDRLPEERRAFLAELDQVIAETRKKVENREPFDLFPVAIGKSYEIGAHDADVDWLGALIRHTMPPLKDDLEQEKSRDERALKYYLEIPNPTTY